MEKQIRILIEKYLNETATQQERLKVEQWIDSSAQNQEIFYELLEKWEQENPKIQVDVEADFQILQDRIEKHERKSGTVNLSAKLLSRSNLLKIAAAVTIILGSYLVFKSQIPFGKNDDLLITHTNPKGIRTKHILPDSSVVWLNADSRLIYQNDFSAALREVELEGEAFFEVKRDTLRPFMVNTSGVSVKVLGTSFNVRAYQEENAIETVVLTGKVSAEPEKGREQLILKPNEKASFARESGKMIKSQVEAESFTLWREGILKINNKTLNQIAYELERWYGVTIILSGKENANCLITGTFDNKSLEETLNYMQALIEMDYQVNGKETRITVHTCDQ